MKRLTVAAAAAVMAATTIVVVTGAAGARSARGCTLHVLGSARSSAAETAAWNQVFAQFKAAYGCTVTAHWQGQFTDVAKELNEARLAHQSVDLVTTGTGANDQAKAGNFLDITKIVKPFASRFSPGDMARFTIGGHIWAIPLGIDSSSVFFYNATLFKQLHLTTPKTFAQFMSVAKTLESKAKIQPLTEGGKDTWEWPMWYMSTFSQTSHNRSLAELAQILEGKKQFTAPDSVAALDALARFGSTGLLKSTALDTDENGAVAAFLQKKAAMFYDGTWVLSTLRSGKPTFQIGVFAFPLVVNGTGVVSQPNGAPEGALAIPSFAPKADVQMAAQFLEFVSRKGPATKVLTPLNPLVPSVKSVPSSKDPLAPILRKQFLPHTIGWLDWIWPNDVNNAVIQSIEGVLYNHQSPADAAKGMQSALDTLKQQQSYKFDWWTTWSKDQWSKVEPNPVPKIQVKQ
jgi:raffinose/stachyose/melibiose transport system substrate-binding protein